jgi:hypothetical protein
MMKTDRLSILQWDLICQNPSALTSCKLTVTNDPTKGSMGYNTAARGSPVIAIGPETVTPPGGVLSDIWDLTHNSDGSY